MYKPVVLLILDGWGISANPQGNAIAQANTPNINILWRNYPALALQAAGLSVGLPWGEMGNSEVGHMVLGAGKIIYQSLPRITLSVQSGTFFSNPAFLKAVNHTRNYQSALHLVGLISNGGVHSHIEHLTALLEFAKNEKTKEVYLHLITDGRDTLPDSAVNFISAIEQAILDFNIGRIASVCGRYFAMDRNLNWDRTQMAYECMIGNFENSAPSALTAIKNYYQQKITDEFIPPTFIAKNVANNKPKNNIGARGAIKDNDAVIFFNFRGERSRQLVKAFMLPEFDGFSRSRIIKNLCFVTMTEYEKGLPCEVAFPPEKVVYPLARVISEGGLRQAHIAETEKYAHVTYFFNGGEEVVFPREERILIPSLSVANFAKRPEMSAHEICERIIKEIEKGVYDFIVANFANPDMVGHTGDLSATVKAVETVDECVGEVVKAVITYKGALLITADHGNAEEKINPMTGETLTEHTTNPVPLWLVTAENKRNKTQAEIVSDQNSIKGFLADVAPTIIELMGLKKPEEMTGQSLLPLLK